MTGPLPIIASWIAHAAFFVLMVISIWNGARLRRTVIFCALWLTGFVGLRFVPYGDSFFMPYVACLDIALVFVIFEGDVKLS
jgi:hypothetical protein